MELAYFYGWTLDTVKNLKGSEFKVAHDFMVEELKRKRKQEGGR